VARRGLLGVGPPAPLLLDLPAAALRPAAAHGAPACDGGEPALTVMVALAEAADPDALGRLRARLRATGWGLALGDLDAAALALLGAEALGRLEADRLALRWSPRLADDRAAAAALRRLDPERLMLLGCDGPEALDWGRAAGIPDFGGRQVDAALAAARLEACPAASGCGAGRCAARGAAADPSGRAGCANPRLLDAALPPPADRAGLPDAAAAGR
jgi:hypothetical protein